MTTVPLEIADALRDYLGSRLILVAGWETHAAPKPSYVSRFDPVGILNHWDAVSGWNIDTYRRNARLNYQPSYHFPIDQSGRVFLIGRGYVYSAGGGDAAVYEAMRNDRDIPPARVAKSMNGNPHFYGAVINYYPRGQAVPDEQLESLTLVNAAICDFHGWDPATRVNDHHGWTTRKSDLSGRGHPAPANWNLEAFRGDVAAQLGGNMPLISEGARKGVDKIFVQPWKWLTGLRVYSQHTNPDEAITAERNAAFLQRYDSRRVSPLENRIAELERSVQNLSGQAVPADVLRRGDSVRLS